MDLHLRDAFPHLSGCPRFLQHELYDEIIHPTDFVIEPKLQEEPTSENIVQALKDDKLMRLADICAFVNLLAQLPGNYVMTVNGRWGSGKTFFVKEAQMIIEGTYGDDSDIRSALESNNVDAQSKNLATVYYDAWLHDGDEDPLASILDSLLRDERIQKDFFSPDKKRPQASRARMP